MADDPNNDAIAADMARVEAEAKAAAERAETERNAVGRAVSEAEDKRRAYMIAAADAREAGLVRVVKGAEWLFVHPTALAEHLALGWERD